MVRVVSYILIAALGLIIALIARVMFFLVREDQAAEIDLREIEESQ